MSDRNMFPSQSSRKVVFQVLIYFEKNIASSEFSKLRPLTKDLTMSTASSRPYCCLSSERWLPETLENTRLHDPCLCGPFEKKEFISLVRRSPVSIQLVSSPPTSGKDAAKKESFWRPPFLSFLSQHHYPRAPNTF